MELQHLLFIVLGLLGLWLGSQFIVNNSVRAAKQMRLSEMFVGLTVLGLGTQLPFIVHSFQLAFDQLHGQEIFASVAVAAVGANLTLMSFVLAISGLISAHRVKKAEVSKNGMMLIACTLVVFFLASDGFISPTDGALMMLLYGVYLFWLHSLSGIPGFKIKFKRLLKKPVLLTFLKIVVGLGIVFFSSNLLLEYVSILIDGIGNNHVIFRLFFPGIAACLPAIAVAWTAAAKGFKNLSLGNLIGSSISTLLLAFGGSALVAGWVVERSVARFDLAYLLFTCVVVVLFLLTRKKLDRKESVLILCLYAVYFVLKFLGF